MFHDVRTDDEAGASAVEYGLLVAGIAALVVAAVFIFGGMVNDIFGGTCDQIDAEAVANSVPLAVSCP